MLEDLFSPLVGRGSAFADFDGDGDLDVVMTQTKGNPCSCVTIVIWGIIGFDSS